MSKYLWLGPHIQCYTQMEHSSNKPWLFVCLFVFVGVSQFLHGLFAIICYPDPPILTTILYLVWMNYCITESPFPEQWITKTSNIRPSVPFHRAEVMTIITRSHDNHRAHYRAEFMTIITRKHSNHRAFHSWTSMPFSFTFQCESLQPS